MSTKILIAGIGGVGGYFGGLIGRYYEEMSETEIYFLARGKNLQQIKKDGLTVITETETFDVQPKLATDNAMEIGKVDYIILATKSYDLVETIHQISPCIGKNTVVVPFLNGLDISSKIRTLLPDIEVWDGCVYIVSQLNNPGIVESSGAIHDLFFGAEFGDKNRLSVFQSILADAGIKAYLREDIRNIIWRKFIFISVTASLTSYFNVGFRDLLTDDNRRNTLMRFFDEILKVAVSEGIALDSSIIEKTIQQIERLSFESTSSMHRDLIAGKSTEIESLIGIVIEIANKNGLQVPNYKKVYERLKEKI